MIDQMRAYARRWRELQPTAHLYLIHAALLTGSLAIFGAFFNIAIEAFGYDRDFVSTLAITGVAVAAISSVPVWAAAERIGYWRALVVAALAQVISTLLVAVSPSVPSLLLSVGLTGIAATLFQVSSPPFMMRHSSDATRDHLFSANQAINIGLAGIATYFAGTLKAQLGTLLAVGAETPPAYRAIFAVAGLGLALSIVPLLLIRSRVSNQESTADQQRANTQAAAARVPLPPAPAAPPTDLPLPVGAMWLRSVPFVVPLVDRLPHNLRAIIYRPWPVLRLLLSPLLISFGAALLIQFLNLFFKDTFVIDDVTIGRVLAIIGIATGVAALIGPAISTRLGKPWTIVLTQMLSVPFLLLMGFVPVLNIVVAAALMRGALFNMAAPLYDAFAMEQTEEDARPIVIGLINGAYTAGYLVAPAISTRVQKEFGFTPLFVATAVLYALAALANYWLFVRQPRLPIARTATSHPHD